MRWKNSGGISSRSTLNSYSRIRMKVHERQRKNRIGSVTVTMNLVRSEEDEASE